MTRAAELAARVEVRGGETEVGWAEFFSVLARQRWLVAVVTGLGAAGALGFSFLQTPTWFAEARAEISSRESTPSALAALSAGLPTGLSSLVGGALPIAGEIERIRSRALARQVLGLPPLGAADPSLGLVRVLTIEEASVWHSYMGSADDAPTPELELREWVATDDFDDPLDVKTLAGGALEIGFRRYLDARTEVVRPDADGTFEFQGARLAWKGEAPGAGRRFVVYLREPRDAVDEFLESLAVSETDRGSNVLRIGFSAPTAGLAAQVCNAVVRSYVADNEARLVESIEASVGYLSGELDRVHADLERAELAMVEYLRDTGPSALPETAEQLVEKLSEIGLEQARARYAGERMAERLGQLGSGRLEDGELAALEYSLGMTDDGASSLSSMLARRDALRAQYTDDWPELTQLEAEIGGRVSAISATLEQLLAEQQEQARDLEALGAELEGQMAGLPDSQLGYARRKRDVTTAQEILLFLRAQLEDARISLAGATPTVDVIDWAIDPERRLRPSLRINLFLGLLSGFVVGLLGAFVREARRPVFSAARLQQLCGCPVLGEVSRGSSPLPMRDAPEGAVADQYRTVRASLQSMDTSDSSRLWTVTSANPNDGAAEVAANLAVALARGGERVLLVEGDHARPRLREWLGVEGGGGLREVLAGGHWEESLARTKVDGLDLLASTAGGPPLADGIASGGLNAFLESAAAQYDRVLFAAPALGSSPDALALAARTRELLYVIRSSTHSLVVERGLEQLRRVGGTPRGAVLYGTAR